MNRGTTIWELSAKGEWNLILSVLKVTPGLTLHSKDDWGWSLLHHAVAKSQLILINELILAGVDVNSVPDRSHSTSLHVAVSEGNYAAAELLLLLTSPSSSSCVSSSSYCNPNIRDLENGWTPLHVAVSKDNGDMVRLIVQYCSSSSSSSINHLDINTLDFGDRSCLQLAVERRTNPSLVVFLINKGARMGPSSLSIPPPLDETEEEEEFEMEMEIDERKEERLEEDVTFILEGQNEVKSNSTLLASRCDYFSILFRSGSCWKEAREKRVDIPSTSLQAFNIFLAWCKTGELSADGFPQVETILELWMLSNQYDIKKLSTLCQRRLRTILEHLRLNSFRGECTEQQDSSIEEETVTSEGARQVLLSSLLLLFDSQLVPLDMKRFSAVVLLEGLDLIIPNYEGDKELLVSRMFQIVDEEGFTSSSTSSVPSLTLPSETSFERETNHSVERELSLPPSSSSLISLVKEEEDEDEDEDVGIHDPAFFLPKPLISESIHYVTLNLPKAAFESEQFLNHLSECYQKTFQELLKFAKVVDGVVNSLSKPKPHRTQDDIIACLRSNWDKLTHLFLFTFKCFTLEEAQSTLTPYEVTRIKTTSNLLRHILNFMNPSNPSYPPVTKDILRQSKSIVTSIIDISRSLKPKPGSQPPIPRLSFKPDSRSQTSLLLPLEILLTISLHLPSSQDIFNGLGSTCKLFWQLSRTPSFIIRRLMTIDLHLAMIYQSIDRPNLWRAISQCAPKFLFVADSVKVSSPSFTSPLVTLNHIFRHLSFERQMEFTQREMQAFVSEPKTTTMRQTPTFVTSFQKTLKCDMVLPPDYLFFLTKCVKLGRHQQGLALSSLDPSPLCWDYNECTALVRIGDFTDYFESGSSYFYLNCDISSPHTWGHFLVYTYRRDKCFHFTQYPTKEGVEAVKVGIALQEHKDYKWFFGDLIQTIARNGAERILYGSGREWRDYIESLKIETKPVPQSIWYYQQPTTQMNLRA